MRLTLTVGRSAGLEVVATASGLLSIGALVSGILLASAVIVRTARE